LTSAGPLSPDWGMANIQKILRVVGGIKQYVSAKGEIAIPSHLETCPFCTPIHPLRRHGFYRRWAVTNAVLHYIRIRRLLCPATKRTVSLLPDFLVPRKQFVLAVIAAFFQAYLWLGLSLAASVRAATRIHPARQKGRFWCRAVASRARTLRAYAAQLPSAARDAGPAPPAAGALRAELHALLAPLFPGAADLVSALRHHSPHMHAALGRTPV